MFKNCADNKAQFFCLIKHDMIKLNEMIVGAMMDKILDENYEQLAKKILACRACRQDFGFEPNPILFGNPDAKIVQISQAPSKTVSETGIPFSDASGQKLKYQWYQLTDEDFYNPNNFYIGAMAHCYPGKNKFGGDNMPPKRCAKLWVSKELDYINNEIFIIIGGYSAKYFFPNEKLTDLVFKENYINGKRTYVLPHPSPLNIRWFKKHPQFEEEEIKKVRNHIQRLINL